MTARVFRSSVRQPHIPGRCDRSVCRGSTTVELVILTPVLFTLLFFVVYFGRVGQGTELVRHAADQGARAASMVNRPAMATTAQRAVAADLEQNGRPCGRFYTTVQVSSEAVTVSVHCWADQVGFGFLRPGVRYIGASSTEVIDRFRGGR